MNVNQLALQLESLLSAAYPQAITMDLSADIEPAGVRSHSAHEFLQALVEEICAYGEIDGILIWTGTGGLKGAEELWCEPGH